MEDELEQTPAEEMRSGIASAGMEIMDVVDDDFAKMMATYCEHILLMQREMEARGIDRRGVIQQITSFTVGVLLPHD